MWEIEKLNLRLPAAFAGRAENIARLLGETLAETDPGARISLDRIEIPALRVPPGVSDQEVARFAARAIAEKLGAKS